MDAAVTNGVKKIGFVSAAETRWDFDDKFVGTPVEWLHRYLVAKRCLTPTTIYCEPYIPTHTLYTLTPTSS